MTKRQLFDRGKVHVHHWCGLNGVEEPTIVESEEPRDYDTCAFYRAGTITISVNTCAGLGTAGRAWSWPGYVVDRTPYGVLCHELGHHVDEAEGTRGGLYSKQDFIDLVGPEHVREGFYAEQIKQNKVVEPISGYHDNVLEWFAEMFRLFVTNPDLLKQLRPLVYAKMACRWPHAAEERSWHRVLNLAERQLRAAENKVREAERKRNRRPKADVAPSLFGG